MSEKQPRHAREVTFMLEMKAKGIDLIYEPRTFYLSNGSRYTQNKAAKLFGISPAYLSLIEKGDRTPGRRLAVVIMQRTNGFVKPEDYD